MAYRNAVICPDCDGELIKRVGGKWCPRCRGWLQKHTRLNGTQYLFIQNYQPKYS